ncbi:MAG: division/cell wall cluster transcriptional repressor MraZ [Chitinophagales bacterium]
MIRFLGEYEATLDAKGRFLFPVGFKRQLPQEEGHRFVINRGFKKNLNLYPVQNWDQLFDEIEKLSEFDPKVREFLDFFLNGATFIETDSAGRLLIPPNLKEQSGLEKDIVLVAKIKRIEIWDSNKYKQLFESFSEERYSNLANEVMNKNRGINN